MKNAHKTSIALALVFCTAAIPAWAADSAAPKAAAKTVEMKETPEIRIKRLHDQLGITAAEESQWSSVAKVMLDNAAAMNEAVQNRLHMAGTMTAISDLKSYQAIVDAHADGIHKLAIAFAPLYKAMPEAQQKHADAVFARRTEPSKLKTHA